MKIGTAIRNMGTTATASCIRQSAETAEAAGLDHAWVVDHLAIPPDDAEGSDGRSCRCAPRNSGSDACVD